MEEIKVGEYVRSSKGKIAKVTSVASEDLGFGKMSFCNIEPHFYEEIVKHSPNIIDLIEVGDYVNGKRVYFDKIEYKLYVGNDYENQTFIKDMDIKTIVTKEQFKNAMYEV